MELCVRGLAATSLKGPNAEEFACECRGCGVTAGVEIESKKGARSRPTERDKLITNLLMDRSRLAMTNTHFRPSPACENTRRNHA